jgi:small subunit ribosomal protein S17
MTSSPSSPVTRRRFEGVVVSISGPSTAVIRVDRRVAHAKYGKYYTLSKRLMIDDPKGVAKRGDTVLIEECRPLSRHKRWRYLSTVRTAPALI